MKNFSLCVYIYVYVYTYIYIYIQTDLLIFLRAFQQLRYGSYKVAPGYISKYICTYLVVSMYMRVKSRSKLIANGGTSRQHYTFLSSVTLS
jgi:hypothetical protein